MIPTRSLTAIGTFAAAAAAVAAAAAAMPGVAHADEFKTYIGQATTLLNVRSTPSTRQPKIGRFSPGDTFKVTGVAGKSEKGNWLQITYQNKTAYVDGTYVTQKQQPAANKKPTQSVQSIQHYQVFTTDNLNVRFLPGISGTVLTTLKKGSAVTVTGKTADGWLQISYKGGSAYVSEKYVQSGSTPRLSAKASVTVQYKGTTTDNLNVRTGATTSAKRLTTLKKGSTVEVVGTNGGWLQIRYGGGTAYVSADYVKKNGSAAATPSKAPVTVQYKGTTTDNLNVRTGATTSAKRLTTLKKGSTVEVVGTSGGWLQIRYGGGTAYVSADYVKKNGTSAATPSKASVTVRYKGTTTDNLNVRTGASTSAKRLTTLKKGSTVEVVGTNGGWLQIKYGGGTAYVSADYVKKNGSGAATPSKASVTVRYKGTTTDNLNVRTGASTSAKRLTTLKKGSTVEVVGTNGGWLQIRYGGGTAYVSADYVKKNGTSAATPSKAPVTVQYKGTTTDNLNVRTGATTSAKRLTTLKKGSTVEVVGTNGGWLQIKYGSGTAYVSADFVQKEGSVATPSQPEQTITGTTANGLITGSGVRFRKSPDGEIMTSFQSGTKVDWLTVTDDKQWVKISYKGTYGYVSSAYIKQETVTMAKAGDVAYAYTKYPLSFGQALAAEKKVNSSSQLAYFLNPNNFKQGTDDYYQFLTLSTHSGATAEELNQFLKNILAGHGSDFIYAADKSGVNEVYLAAHAMLETGNGTSTLANGVYYKGKKVYNMFGVGAYDLDPKNGGAALAYQQKWYSPSDAIIGGAKWIANHYIYNATYQQDTLYKMRWNPDALVSGSAAHQYATDPAWADSQSRIISNMYMKIKIKNLIFNVTQYS